MTRKMPPRPQEALQVTEEKQRQTNSAVQGGSARAEAHAGYCGDNRREEKQRLTSCGPMRAPKSKGGCSSGTTMKQILDKTRSMANTRVSKKSIQNVWRRANSLIYLL